MVRGVWRFLVEPFYKAFVLLTLLGEIGLRFAREGLDGSVAIWYIGWRTVLTR